MLRLSQVLATSLAVLLVTASTVGAGAKGEYYFLGSSNVEVVARDFGTTVSIRQYSRAIESPPSKRFVIRTHEYYLDLDVRGNGLLRSSPSGRACGTWSIDRASGTMTLRRQGITPPPRDAWVTKANYFRRPYLFVRHDASAESAFIVNLKELNHLKNQWVAAGGKVSEGERE